MKLETGGVEYFCITKLKLHVVVSYSCLTGGQPLG